MTCDEDTVAATRTWPGSCGAGDCLAWETIVVPGTSGFTFAPGLGAADFAVPHWKLVSEGSSWAATAERCLKDVVPEAPLAGLCSALDADPAHDCALVTFPGSPHCGAFGTQLGAQCVGWFEAL